MKVTVNLPEEIVEKLGGPAAAEQALIQRLHALPNYKLGDKVVVLDTAARVRMEQTLHATLDTAEDVVLATKRLAMVAIGEVSRPLSAGEAARVKAYAEAHHIDYHAALTQIVDPIIGQWLETV